MSERQMKGITVCADCVYYSLKKHKCNRGCTDEGKPTDHFYADCPLPDVEPVRHGHWIDKPTGKYGNWQSYCSACGKHSQIGGIESNRHKPRCPWCGAFMDEVLDDG